MARLPIVPHLRPDPPPSLQRDADLFAEAVLRERPDLVLPESFRELAAEDCDEGPTLHLEDLSHIPRPERGRDLRFLQDRARLRAGDDDLVATCGDPVPGHGPYYRDYLGLGAPECLRPHLPHVPLRIAEACWTDDTTRRALVDRVRRGKLTCIHPNMGTLSVWELAYLLYCETGRPIQVLGPPPSLTRWANDKVAFATTVARLFGREMVPRTESACNGAALALRVKEMSEQSEMLGFKLPLSAGGDGNVVVAAERFRGQSLQDIRKELKEQLHVLDWDGTSELLIDRWETDVVCSPSTQIWIPPERHGPPIVEGIFVQTIEGREGVFVGTAPARFPSALTQEITDRSWLLARVFQSLGYVGRCSFDLIVVGDSLEKCRLEFIECNGRWGGTSLYMTLMNRIFGDWEKQPFAVHVAHGIPGLDRFTFVDFLNGVQEELFDVRTGRGSLIFTTPGRLSTESGITVTVLAPCWDDAAREARRMPERLRQMVRERPAASGGAPV